MSSSEIMAYDHDLPLRSRQFSDGGRAIREVVRSGVHWPNGPHLEGITVLVQHYNRPWLVEVAVLSLKRQLAHENVTHEIILADDGSDQEVLKHLDALPLDVIVTNDRRVARRDESSVYQTLAKALERARYPYVLFVQDDFWLIPQGFTDHGKCHIEGLRTKPEFGSPLQPLSGAAMLLDQKAEAHFVELARSFRNPRYDCLSNSDCQFRGVSFRAKRQASHARFYTCDWPHVQRTAEMRRTPLPLGMAIWPGETHLESTRREIFGSGDWVYNSSHCFFIHVNVFTWRVIYKHGLDDAGCRWADVDREQGSVLPFESRITSETNGQLLEAYLGGRIRNDFDAYCEMAPDVYLRKHYGEPLHL